MKIFFHTSPQLFIYAFIGSILPQINRNQKTFSSLKAAKQKKAVIQRMDSVLSHYNY